MPSTDSIQREALFRLSYGLYLLAARSEGGDNACVINTAIQVTDAPCRILFAVNRGNHTASLLAAGEAISLTVLSEGTPFSVYRRFGFQSGRDTDKFADLTPVRDSAGVPYLADTTSAVISAVIESVIPCDTHLVYLASVTEARVLSDIPPVTYTYYQQHVKPAAKAASEREQRRYVCTVCGYVYEGEALPPDFVCPVCKHGANVFEERA